MAANVTVPNNFVAGAPAVADDVDANFQSILDWINANAVHLDASKAFTAIPSGPASDPTNANHLARKAYVDVGHRGTLGYAQITASQVGITAVTDVTGLSVTFTAVAGRRYKITAEGYLASSVIDDVCAMQITDGSNNQVQSAQTQGSANATIKAVAHAIVVPGAGSRTYKVRALRAGGTGNVTFFAATNAPAFILVEDIGPA